MQTILSQFDETRVKEEEKKPDFNKTKLDRWLFVRRSGAIRNEGMLWYPAWRDIAKYILPTRGFFFEQRPNVGYEIDHKTVVDSTAEQAISTLAAGMQSGLTSPSRPWFKLSLGDDGLDKIANVNYWLDDTQRRMEDVFAKSNVYGCLNSMYEEVGGFGTACALLEEDPDDVIRMRVYTVGEYYLATGPDGRVNSFYRRFWMTVAQLVKEFGINNVSPQVKTMYQNQSPDTWVRINFLIEPNDARVHEMKDWKNMAFRSVYWEDGAMVDKYLRMGGFNEFPILSPRWSTVTTADSYGRSPGWKMLGDVKMLQKLQVNKLIALDKVTNPPVQVDASVQGEANMLPGGVTRFSAMLPNAGVKPAYQVNPDLQAIELTIEKTQKAIKEKSFADLFLMLIESEQGRQPPTAEEIRERQAEKLTILGPVLERLEGELLSPLIERTFNIMFERGLITPPPKEISGMELKIKYISVLAQAQKMVGVTAMQQVIAYAQQLAATQLQYGQSEVVDNINFDEQIQEYALMLGIPAKTMNSPEMRDALRKAKREALAAQQQQQEALATTEALSKGASAAKNLGTTPMGQNSALDAVLAGMKGAT
jgi:hypothetical protein